MVVILSGGTGGAKLARGLLEVVGSELTAVANTGDDVEVYGVQVSPDSDLITYWLADVIDPRGWGLRGDTWEVMTALERAGRPTWFRLGDRDLAMCLLRTELLRAGRRLTEAQATVAASLGVAAAVLPMSDEPVRTEVMTGGRWRPFQEYMIVEHGDAPVEDVAFRHVERARPTPEVVGAIAAAEAVVIGPSNPVVSIGPLLAVPGMRESLRRASSPVVAVSPFVDGRALKGPTELFCAWAGIETGAAGVLAVYEGIIDGLVSDEPAPAAAKIPTLELNTTMDTPAARARVAAATLEFARTLLR